MGFRVFLTAVSLIATKAHSLFVGVPGMRPWNDRRSARFRVILASALLVTASVLYVLIGTPLMRHEKHRIALLTENIDVLMQQRAEHIAFIHCALDSQWTEENLPDWPICGIVGDPRKTLTRSNTPEDRNVVYTGIDASPVQTIQADELPSERLLTALRGALVEWQGESPTHRVELRKLLRDSDAYRRLRTVLDEPSKRIGRHPSLGVPAYVSREVLHLAHSLTLFEVNGIRVNIAEPATGLHPYTPFHFPVPNNIREYSVDPLSELLANRSPDSLNPSAVDSPELKKAWQSQARLEPSCTKASRWAVLVHEPHGKPEDEAALFFFLHYLQRAYPEVFAEMHLFQEGQPHAYDISQPFPPPPFWRWGDIDNMIQESSRAWKTPQYSPLNQSSNTADVVTLHDNVRKSLDKVGYNHNDLDGRWEAAIKFYAHRAPGGALDLLKAMQNHLEFQIDQHINRHEAQQLLHRIRSLAPGDAKLAQWLIKDMGFRGAFAYKLYIEGGVAPATTIPASGGNRFKVAIYGLEDFGLYFTSCALYPGCLGNPQTRFNPIFNTAWKPIQPYRDWVMARSALQTLEQLDRAVVPIIAASVRAHLPLIREVFCRAGYNTATLAVNRYNWRSPKHWSATTPILRLGPVPSGLPDSGQLRPLRIPHPFTRTPVVIPKRALVKPV